MYLQEEPSTPPRDEPSRDTDEATDPDEFTQVNAHHNHRSQCNQEFTGLNVIAYLGKGSFTHSPGPMEVFKTQTDDKSIHTQGTNHHARNTSMCSSTSALYRGPNLPALPDQIFAGYLFLCLTDAHGKT